MDVIADASPTPGQVASRRLSDQATPTETFGANRLDLRTDEARTAVAADTPGPLTARGLASVRREAGAGRFPGGSDALGEDGAWDCWAEGLDHHDGRMAQLDDDLSRHRSRLGRYASRLLSSRSDNEASRIPEE